MKNAHKREQPVCHQDARTALYREVLNSYDSLYAYIFLIFKYDPFGV